MKENQITSWIVKTPFMGHTQSVVYSDSDEVERVAYTARNGSKDETLAEYFIGKDMNEYKLISSTELDQLIAEHESSLITEPSQITVVEYDDYLGCLPPCRWHGIPGFTVFHISERLTGNLAQWCATDGVNYWAFTDSVYATDDHLAATLNKAAAA